MTTTRARTITRTATAALVAVLLVAAAVFGRTELVTGAMLVGLAGVAGDVRRTQRIARER
jgi:hypothetical protein